MGVIFRQSEEHRACMIGFQPLGHQKMAGHSIRFLGGSRAIAIRVISTKVTK